MYPIRFLKREFQTVFVEGVYAFNPSRPFRWLQRLAFWVLRKLKCEKNEAISNLNEVTVTADSVMDAIRQAAVLCQQQGLSRPRRILIGHEWMKEALKHEVPMIINLNDFQDMRGFRPQYRGITLISSPFFKTGIVPLPDDL